MGANAGITQSCALGSGVSGAGTVHRPRRTGERRPDPIAEGSHRIVVGVGAGGACIRIYTPLLAAPLQQKLGQPVIVENRLRSGGLQLRALGRGSKARLRRRRSWLCLGMLLLRWHPCRNPCPSAAFEALSESAP